MLFLKSLPASLRAHEGIFQWPGNVGDIVTSDTWDPYPCCGGGLHGLVNGEGDHSLLCHDPDAIWIAFESVDEHGNPSDDETIIIDWKKGKCHRAIIRAIGTRDEATGWLVRQGCTRVVYAKRHVGNNQIAAVGTLGTATSSYEGIAIGEYGATAKVEESGIAITKARGTSQSRGNNAIAITDHHGNATVEDRSIAIAGDLGNAKGAENSIAIAKDGGHATVGADSIAITGDAGKATSDSWGISIGRQYAAVTSGGAGCALTGQYGEATVGCNGVAITEYGGKAISGECGTSIADRTGKAITGVRGVAIADVNGYVSGGEGSVLILYSANETPVVAIVGQNGIKPDTLYKLQGYDGPFVEADTGT